MSQNDQPHLSLLSLSIAAESTARPSQGATTNTTKHRRLSSAGRSRRRLSDARDAATRPFPTSLQTASASLAALSLSSPTTASHRSVPGAQPIQVPRATSTKGTSEPEPASVDDDTHLSLSPPQSHTPLASNSVNVAKSGRKRGTIFTCESCSKVYRHPSCLIKHRWEHTPQWREASKFVLSKHQQVQLLEAAAILSHLSPSSASLPEDRSLWPSFLSGGLVPPPASVSNSDVGPTTTATSPPTSALNVHTSFPISSSVPASTLLESYRAGSTGPRLHDYTVGEDGIGITQVRPGLLGVSTASMSVTSGKSSPVSVPAQTAAAESGATTTTEDDALNLLALHEASVTSESWGSPTSVSLSHSHSYSHSHAHPHPHMHTHSHSHSHSHSLSYPHPHSHSHSHSLSLPHASKERERRRSNAYEYGFVSGTGTGSGFGFGHDYKPGSSRYTYAPDANGTWSLPSSSVRSKSGSSGSRSRSQSASESRSDEEDEGVFGDGVDVHVDLGLDLDGRMGLGSEGGARVYGPRVRAWKTEDGEGGTMNFGVREDEREDGEDEKRGGAEQTWDGMEMEMEMD